MFQNFAIRQRVGGGGGVQTCFCRNQEEFRRVMNFYIDLQIVIFQTLGFSFSTFDSDIYLTYNKCLFIAHIKAVLEEVDCQSIQYELYSSCCPKVLG